jgi:putative transposase
MVVSRKLRREGVRYKRLRWNSNAFQSLRNRIGANADVLIRVDPIDLGQAYALEEDTGEWHKGDLIAESEVEKYTLAQYDYLRKMIDNERVFDDAHALRIAQAAQDIRNLVDSRRYSDGIVPKPIARFVTDGRKSAEHIYQQRFDPDESEKTLGSHVVDTDTPSAAPPDARGPWREKVIKGTATASAKLGVQNSAPSQVGAPRSPLVPASELASPDSPVVFPGRRRKQ